MNEKETFDFKDNSFTFIRYVAAIAIMIGHYLTYAMDAFVTSPSYSIVPGDEIVLITLGKILAAIRGVPMFFCLSAYLICASVERSNSALIYYKKRFLRIYPELWLSMIVNLISIKSCVWGGVLHNSIIKWIAIQGAGMAYTPDFLNEYATGSINGAMWTISVTIQFYFIIWFAYRVLKKLNIKQWVTLLVLMGIINIVFDYANANDSIVTLASRTIIPYMLWLGIGAFIYVYRNRAVPLLRKICIPLVCVYLVYYIVNQIHPLGIPGFYCSIVGGVLLPLITISVGYKLKTKITKDYSYGLYLYHWIVLNCMVQTRAFEKVNWLVCILGFILFAFALAVISQIVTCKIIRIAHKGLK